MPSSGYRGDGGGGGSGSVGKRSAAGRTYDGYASLPSGAGSAARMRRDHEDQGGEGAAEEEDAYYVESEFGGKRSGDSR